jgi:DNA-binding transcriptional LysR family regulator
MALTFRRLEVFVAVAENGNFRKAADRLGISQPSVSSQIKSMERYLGYQLFDRHRGALAALSSEGRSFLTQARDLVAAQNALASARLGGARVVPLHLKVLIGPLLLERCVTPGLAAFRQANPHVDLQVQPFSSGTDAEAAFHRGDADVMLYTGALPECGDGETAEVISRISCSLYGAPALVRPVLQGQRALDELPFLLLAEHFRITQWTLDQFARKGVIPRHIVSPRPQSLDHLLQMVLAGRGVGMFFDIEIASHMRSGRVLPCGPALDPVSRVMVIGPRARAADVAPLLAFLRQSVRKDDEAIATQHARLGHPGLLVGDDSLARLVGL